MRPALKLNLTSGIFTSSNLNADFPYDNQIYNDDLAQWTANYCDKLDDGINKLKSILTGAKENGGGYPDNPKEIKDYPSNPNDSDGIGFVLAHKIINGTENLFTVVVRGTESLQWTGDMNITGETYDPAQRTHTSFAKAKEIVKTQLKSFMSTFSGKKTVLITGHSRGAAVANLLAKDMTDENYKVFAYTYATPNVSLDAATNYHNIYNFCFTDDFVARSPLERWEYGKYGITYWATAQKLYSQSSLFKKDTDSEDLNDFNSWKTDTFVKYMKAINPNTWSYYNLPLPDLLPPHDLSVETTHLLLAYKIAPLLWDKNWAKAAGAMLTLGAINNDTCFPIITYFGDGYFFNRINSTHNPKTYHSAIKYDGFGANSGKGKFSPDAVTGAKKNVVTNALSGAETANPNAAELQQLLAFVQQGSNMTTLGWNMDDISTWTGITWNDETENRVQSIDLSFKNLTGTLDISGFSGLQSLNCAGNQLTAIDFSGCSALTEADVSHNNLTGISLADCTLLEKLECSWNQITSLDAGSCAALKYLYCEYNSLAAINVGNNTSLIEFYCDNNNLSQLDVSANTALNTLGCDYNYLNIQDGSAVMAEIQNIMTRDGAWVSYSPQKVPEAAAFNTSDIAELTAFANTDTNLTKLGWDLATPKDWACVEWAQAGTEYRVKALHFESLGLTGSLDLSAMTSLTNLSCGENALTGLNLSGCTALQYLTCTHSQLQSLNITNCAAITKLNCENNYLDVSAGTALRTCIDSLAANNNDLIVYEPQMILAEVSSFNAAEYSALSAFAQTDSNLTALGWDLSKPGEWQGVKWISVNGEYRATEIDFSGMAVTGALDVSAFNLLTAIDCSGSGISSVSLPAALTAIGNSAFSGCGNLTSIVIPNGVETIGEKAFYGCGNLADVAIGDKVNAVGFGTFAGCSNLSNITVSGDNSNFSVVNGVLFNFDGTTLICYPAGSTATDYVISNSVTSIEKGAFFGCTNLESVVIGTGITSLTSESFSQCANLKNVDISESVENIESGAFAYCPKLKEIFLPASITAIQDNAFLGCMGLEKVVAEKTLTDIGEHAFAYFEDEYLPLPSLTVYCFDGSAAHTYALANDIPVNTFKFSLTQNSAAKVNLQNGYIYGLAPGLASLVGYLEPAEGYVLEYIPTANGFGTGTAVNIRENSLSGNVAESYILVIFGDINGEGSVSVIDALMALQASSGLITLNDVQNFAGNVNNDTDLTVIDALKILQYSSGIITAL